MKTVEYHYNGLVCDTLGEIKPMSDFLLAAPDEKKKNKTYAEKVRQLESPETGRPKHLTPPHP